MSHLLSNAVKLDSLTWKEYAYVSEPGPGSELKLRPKLNVRISHGGKDTDVLALLDSGGDSTIINAEFASVLGINLEDCEQTEIGGVIGGGKENKKAWFADVRVSLQHFEQEEFKIRARFVENMTADMILGQTDIFEHFLVIFDRKKRKFYLSKN